MTDRRSFIAKAATIGVGTTLGAGASAQRRLAPRTRRTATDAGRATTPLTLSSAPKIARSTASVGPDSPSVASTRATRAQPPSSRDGLLNAIARAPGGEQTLRDTGVLDGEYQPGGHVFPPRRRHFCSSARTRNSPTLTPKASSFDRADANTRQVSSLRRSH
ncbi:MAG TPA: hypothetical protein QGH10_11980 [Armatimonadota bacterium]|nr:hypothetical protein [Armatimonadota bacterium]